MTASRTDTVAARIPADLRADLERLAALRPLDNGHGPSLTPHIRRALREYVDRELRREATNGDPA